MKKIIISSVFFLSLILKASPIQVPDEACDLVDQADYMDLIGTVKALSEKMKNVPKECLTGNGANTSANTVVLQQSATKLQEYWGNTALATQNPGDFGSTLQSAMSSVNSIAQGIQSSALNSACADKMKGGDWMEVLGRVSDVSLSLAPVAMMAIGIAKIALPGYTIPLMIGLSILATGTKTIGELYSKDIIKLDTTEERLMVLKSVCDYQKVKRNIDFISFIENGRAKVEAEEAKLRRNLVTLEKSLPVHVRSKVNEYKEEREKILAAEGRINKAKVMLSRLDAVLVRNNNQTFQCLAGQAFISSNSILSTLEIQKFNITKVNTHNLSISALSASTNYSTLTAAQNTYVTELANKKYDLCQKALLDWRGNLISLLTDLRQLTSVRSDELFTRLQADDDFRTWSLKAKDMEKDRLQLQRILAFMSNDTKPSSIISKAELYDQRDEVHNFLLGKGKMSLRSFGRITLVGEWLKRMKTSYEDSNRKFKTSFNLLNLEINAIAYNAFKKAKLPFEKKSAEYKSILHSKSMEQIGGKYFIPAVNSYEWQRTCGRLKELYLVWTQSITHFKAVEFFCSSIKDLQDASIHETIMETCFGDNAIASQNRRQSWVDIQVQDSKLNERRGVIVKSKMLQLKCSVPQRPN